MNFIYDFNAFSTPVLVTGTTDTTLTFSGGAGVKVRFTGLSLTYNETAANLYGVVTKVEILNSAGTDVIESIDVTNSSDLVGRINIFIQNALKIANLVEGWFDGNFDHVDTAHVVYGGTTMSVPVMDATNTLLGYIKMTGTGLTSAGLSTGKFTSIAHEDASHVTVVGDAVTYGLAGTSTTAFQYGLLKNTGGIDGVTGLIDPFLTMGHDTITAYGSGGSISGGNGNDIYNLGSFAVDVIDTAGTDKIVSTMTRSLASLSAIENLTLTGTTAIDGTGNASNNIIIGNGAANTILGLGGNDTLDGAGGNDTVRGGDGIDTITGGLGNDAIFGDGGNDIIRAGDGIDTINGGLGNDQIFGDAGNDVIRGGAGRDTLTGGLGGDTFVIDVIGDSGKSSSTRDYIADFIHNASVGLSDRIDLSAIDAAAAGAGNNAFSYIGKGLFTGAAGQLHIKIQDLSGSTNDRTFVEGDTNGDKLADFQIEIFGIRNLVAADFVL